MAHRQKNRHLLGRSASIALALVSVFGLSHAKSKQPAIVAPTGLTEVSIAGFHRSFVRAGSDLVTPRTVCVNSGELTFAADSPRKIYGRLISQADLQSLQKRFNDAVRTEFEKTFSNQAGYSLVNGTADADCALRVVVSIRDLHLNVPEVMIPASTKSYARSVGWLRVRIDVMDRTGAVLLAQAHGARTDREQFWGSGATELLSESHRITDIDNIAFARTVGRVFGEYTRTRLLARR